MKKRNTKLPPTNTTSSTIKALVPFIEASGTPLIRIANRAGVSRYTIYRWLRGEGHPGVIELEAIAKLVDAEVLVVSQRTADIVRKYTKEPGK